MVGHSRGGKTAPWCGAQDARIAFTFSNESGTTGTAVSRFSQGETVGMINGGFPHWFNQNYKSYGNNLAALPVDQRELIALVAPRFAYIGVAEEDHGADAMAQFLGGIHAGPVYGLFGYSRIVPAIYPPAPGPLHAGRIGFHPRAGVHDLLREDWSRFMDFDDRYLTRTTPTTPPVPAGAPSGR